MNYLITIIGPTAIGKTALSIVLAQHFKCDILSCDSRQFYKEMTIGTAVPTKQELSKATHHFIQNKSIFESYSVGNYEKESLHLLNHLFKKSNIQIMVGGSGLYVNAVLNGLDDFPEIESKIRTQININFERLGICYLQEQLKKLDAKYYQELENTNPQTLQNPQRLKRFIEVCIGTQKPYSSYIGKQKNNRNFTPIIIGLEANRDVMYNRINSRVDAMMQDGLVAEAQKLYSNKHLNALQTVGYKELFDYFEYNNQDVKILENAIEQIKINTRRFAKRQITWFKRTQNVLWFDYQTSPKNVIETIEKITR
ncbi:MAG TPA: tRNA (adenosine(37)-N6)-dimethylallyltransferase MiaA [Flavobacterium sp.]|nr:tRNA (adenosine(37)-N6)-dimethylallyltransferase MiaA [Flavobacterium sp.]